MVVYTETVLVMLDNDFWWSQDGGGPSISLMSHWLSVPLIKVSFWTGFRVGGTVLQWFTLFPQWSFPVGVVGRGKILFPIPHLGGRCSPSSCQRSL